MRRKSGQAENKTAETQQPLGKSYLIRLSTSIVILLKCLQLFGRVVIHE